MHNFGTLLLEWYKQFGRALPWRGIGDPYAIWVSEVILQQTQVIQGTDYYHRFIARFPDVHSLAQADEQEVLRLWQGLGYYSRARNMHFAAKQVVNDYGGVFPNSYKDLLILKGVGSYTAAAIASFAFGEPVAVVDGNVMRLLSRIFNIHEPIDTSVGKSVISALASELMVKDKIAIYNQAIMDFGATQCTPRSPDCSVCPFSGTCLALREGSISVLPKKKGKVTVQNRFITFLIVRVNQQKGRSLLIKQQKEQDIWKNLYLFPRIERTQRLLPGELLECREYQDIIELGGAHLVDSSLHEPLIHILSHRRIVADYILFSLDQIADYPAGFIEVDFADLDQFPMPRLMHKLLEKNEDYL